MLGHGYNEDIQSAGWLDDIIRAVETTPTNTLLSWAPDLLEPYAVWDPHSVRVLSWYRALLWTELCTVYVCAWRVLLVWFEWDINVGLYHARPKFKSKTKMKFDFRFGRWWRRSSGSYGRALLKSFLNSTITCFIITVNLGRPVWKY